MLGKRSRPLVPGNRSRFPDMITSPNRPLEYKIISPGGLKDLDLGGVGLGIVAALEKSGGSRAEILAKFVVGSLNLNRPDPNLVGSARTSTKFRGGIEGSEMGWSENYTFVTSHIPQSFSRVYCDGVHDRRCRRSCVSGDSPTRFPEIIPAFPTSDFLSSCHLCRKKLHGKDIYMYRGEKAFCSSECRYRQIVTDERKEKCGSEASRTTDNSSSSCSGGRLFSTGIIAA